MRGKNPGHGFYIRLRIQSGKRGIASENHDFEKSFITESWSDTVSFANKIFEMNDSKIKVHVR